MRQGLLLIPAIVVSFAAAHLARCSEPVKMSDTAIQGAFQEYNKIADRFGIEIILEKPPFPPDGHIAGHEASATNVATFLALFKQEWTFYPPEFIAESGLRRIIFCEELMLNGHHFGGTAGGGKGDALYIDVGSGRWSKMHIRELIHHEFFHIMDRRMHLNAGIRHGLEDKQWASLNPADFKYDKSIQVMPDVGKVDPKLKGFLNKYSQSAVEEDKAVLYGFMVTMGQIVDERAKLDPVLKAKVDRMKELVKQLSPKMDDEFWRAARKVTRLGG